MAWYKTGTVALTNGSATVAGTGTAWNANVQIGDAILLPDGRSYEITALASDTSMTISPAYLGTTASGQTYRIQPTRGLIKRMIDSIAEWTSSQQAYIDGPLAGRFGNGSAALPGMAFLADITTGLFRPAAGQIGMSTGGVQRALLSSAGLNLSVPLNGTAVTQSATDTTPGRVMKVGDFGLGSLTPPFLVDFDAIDTPLGPRYFDATTLNNTTGITAGQMFITRYNSAALGQWVINGTLFLVRTYSSGAWGAWRRMFSGANILANVSLSGGVATGGIIERGSNANGEYAKYADGTLICQQSGITFTYLDADNLSFTWSYPAAFVAGSVPSRYHWLTTTPGDFTGVTAHQIGGLRLGSGVISAAHRLYRAQGSANFAAGNQIANCGLTAIGRWV